MFDAITIPAEAYQAAIAVKSPSRDLFQLAIQLGMRPVANNTVKKSTGIPIERVMTPL
jgi:hypothetical protein